MAELKTAVRPEFLNRIDDTIMFLPLTKEQIAGVVRLQMDAVRKMLEPQASPSNIPTRQSTGSRRGIRSGVRRTSGEEGDTGLCAQRLSKKLLAEEVSREKPVIIDANGAGLVFRN